MKISKVFFLYPPGPMYQRGEDRSQGNIDSSTATAMRAPNDAAYVLAQLKKENIQNLFIDYPSEKKSINDLYHDFKNYSPDLVIISTTNSTLLTDIKLIDKLKNISSSCIFILKGAIFFKAPEELINSLNLYSVDYLIGGEIEFTAINIIREINKGSNDFSNIPGIFIKDGDKWKETQFDNWNKEIDDLPIPNRDEINNSLYIRPDTGEAQATIATSRGCPASCIYCLTPAISGKKVRFRSPQSIVKEMEECFFKQNIRNFFFKSDTFTIDHKWVIEVTEEIKKSKIHKKIEWVANSRVRPLKKETLLAMKESGCWLIAFGFETGSEETMKKIKKGASIEDNLKAAKLVKEVGLKLYGFFLIGLPWENHEHLEQTKKHIFKINADFIELHLAVPYYGTELYDIAKKEGILKVPVVGQNYFEESTIGTKYLTSDYLIKYRRKLLLKYHMRSKYIFDRGIEMIKDPRKISGYFQNGKRLIKNVLLT